MRFKENVYLFIEGEMFEKYQETDLSKAVEEIMYNCIGNIAQDIMDKKTEILLNVKENSPMNISTVAKRRYSITVRNLYRMKEREFQNVADEVKKSLIIKQAMEELIKDKLVKIKADTGFHQLGNSNADTEIYIRHNEGSKSVYIYHLYLNKIYEIY
ncbi:hypothetical protein ACJDU8_09765 [Clostridium sp. WILCCON 0269]|uniref:Uncharacterized protein n=1 Tax=Candidatus Clostridium eludens TaxID=3381663 RepID=A0ABW8SKV1_9CLOT